MFETLTAEIIAIGSELLAPDRTDTNSLWLTEQLNRLGIEVKLKTIVGDDDARLEEAIKDAVRRSKVVITTGSHTAVPICLLGKLLRVKIIWILSFARINTRARSASIVYPIADRFIVQWEPVQHLYPKSIYLGGIY